MSHLGWLHQPGRAFNSRQAVTFFFVLFVVVAVFAWAGIVWTRAREGIATFWLVDGIVAAVMLSQPGRRSAATLACGCLGTIAASLAAGDPAGIAVPLALTDSIGIFLVARSLRRWPDLSATAAFLRFVLIAGVLAPGATATLAAEWLHLRSGRPLFDGFLAWFGSHALGFLAGMPPVLCLFRGEMSALFARGTWVRSVALLAGTIAITIGLFVQSRYPLLFLIPPMAFVVASQVGFAGIALFVPMLAGIGLVCTEMGRGPFSLDPAVAGDERRLVLLAFVAATLLLGRVVATVALELRAERIQLIDREATFRLLTDHTSDIVMRVGPDGRWRYVSPAAHRLFGLPTGSLVGLQTLDFAHPDDRPAMRQRIQRLTAGRQEEQRSSFRVIRPDGSQAWVEASTQVLFDPTTGVPDGYVSVLRDISSRVAAEAALLESRECLRLLLDGVSDHAVYMLTPDGRVASWNTGAERIKGYRAEEIIGESFARFFTAEDRAAGEPARLLELAGERGHVEREAWRVRKDGSRFWARAALTAIRDDAGGLHGFAKVAHDLTGRKIEEAQRAIMIEAAPNGMLIVDEAGIITLANAQAERIFGYAEGTLSGLPVEALVPEPLRPAHARLRAAFGEGGGAVMSHDRQFTGRRQDGSTVAVQVLLRPVRTSNGSITVASVFDVTERLRLQAGREAEQARVQAEAAETNAQLEGLARDLAVARDTAEEASEAKSRFLTGVTHELRTPLNGILGYAQLLRLEGGLTPGQDARVTAMLAAGEHLLGMINAVLDLSEIESGRMELRLAELDLASVVQACLDVVRPAAEGKGLALDLEAATDAPARLVADPVRLRQVLLNLLGNAVKFTPVGRVVIRLLPGEGRFGVRIEVADTGPGIAAADSDRLFGEFERIEVDRQGTMEGSGLGLSITARLVQRMGGSIGHADNPGGGSLFWITIADAGIAAGPAPGTPAAAGATACRRILVVDDVAMNRDIAGAFLRLAGHEVISADSGLAAIAAVEKHDFDVVLMDVRMHGMDGLEATRRIRALGGARGAVPIVALTAQAFADQLETCTRAGMTGHLSKPFTQPALLAAVVQATAASAPVLDGIGPGVAAPAVPIFGADLPLLDEAVFRQTASVLPGETLLGYMQILAERGERLLPRLYADGEAACDAPAETIAAAAHALSGSAGMFGFARLAATARHFEHATDSNLPERDDLTASLVITLQASIPEMRRRMVRRYSHVGN